MVQTPDEGCQMEGQRSLASSAGLRAPSPPRLLHFDGLSWNNILVYHHIGEQSSHCESLGGIVSLVTEAMAEPFLSP